MKTRHIPLLLLLSGLLVLNLACSDDDEDTITGTGTPTYRQSGPGTMATEGLVVPGHHGQVPLLGRAPWGKKPPQIRPMTKLSLLDLDR